MKNIRVFLSENFQFLEVKFSIYLNRRVFVMMSSSPPIGGIICYTGKLLFGFRKSRVTMVPIAD